ncbi:energy transducer TonB [Afifella sp. IM 167]|uniref:energy transducer TonB family protein n=1 Tax=Afifella sp. IM 167 TaxID=2033586 RepID=UPI001CCC7092|nr:energy transducer TonB [Afifella sp. IM 167]MBZ8135183.1 hypothetical protein [Afifella sp. IM 167]
MRAERLHWSLAIGGAALLHLCVLFYFAQAAEPAAGGGAGRPQAVIGIAEANLFLPTSEDAPPVEQLLEVARDDTAEPAEEVEEVSEAEPVELASVTPEEVSPVAPEEIEPADLTPETEEAREAEELSEVEPETLSEAEPTALAERAAEEAAPLPPVAEPLQSVAVAREIEPLPETPLPQARPDEVPPDVLVEYRRQQREEARERERRAAERKAAAARVTERKEAERKAAARQRAGAAQPRKAASAAAVAGRQSPRDPGPSRRTLSNYNSRVYSHLARHKRFPSGARRNGVATVRFTLSASGGAGGVRLVASSGDPALDQAATAMVKRASPFPPIPSEIGRSSMTFTVPINFARR